MSAHPLLDALSEARNALYRATQATKPGQTAIDAATLVAVVDEITHLTIFTHQVWHNLRRRGSSAAGDDRYPDAAREVLTQFTRCAWGTARLAGATVTSAHRLRDVAQAVRDAVRELKKCPECGELARRTVPTDLTAQQRAQGLRPSYAHHDRSQLCPVVGNDGYEPAQPVPATITL